MLQDISPHQYNCTFAAAAPKDDDYLLFFSADEVLLRQDGDSAPHLPRMAEVRAAFAAHCQGLIYLFSVDERSFYLKNWDTLPTGRGFCACRQAAFRDDMLPGWEAFAGSVACQLSRWYRSHRYCGRCGQPMQPGTGERVLLCPSCGQLEYPKIAPAIIVGIINGEYLLLSKYAGRSYQNYALIAGFMEIGETLEDTVRREVMEEVGLRVKNIRYYKSQPWAFTDSLLVGFFADLDGSDTITLDERELSEAVWMHKTQLPGDENTMSLTRTMMNAFRSGSHPPAPPAESLGECL